MITNVLPLFHILRVHYEWEMDCFILQGRVSTLFRWGGYIFSRMFVAFLPAYSSAKIIKIECVFPELWSQMYCHVFFGPQCIYTGSCEISYTSINKLIRFRQTNCSSHFVFLVFTIFHDCTFLWAILYPHTSLRFTSTKIPCNKGFCTCWKEEEKTSWKANWDKIR